MTSVLEFTPLRPLPSKSATPFNRHCRKSGGEPAVPTVNVASLPSTTDCPAGWAVIEAGTLTMRRAPPFVVPGV